MNPKVSVVVPVYNSEPFLEECLNNLLSQTLKEIEIIIINDGSTDNSLEIIKEFSKKDSRIKFVTTKNQGVGKARNEGICLSMGDYVAFLDPDDTFPYVYTLENLYNAATKNNAKICGGSFWEYNPVTGVEQTSHSGPYAGFDFNKDGWIEYKDYQFDYGYYRFLYDRKFLLKHKIFFPPYSRYQDPPFFVKAMIKAGKFYALKEFTYKYRQTPMVLPEKKVFDLLLGCKDILRMAEKHKLYNLYYLTLVNRINEQYYNFIVKYLDNKDIKRLVKSIKVSKKIMDKFDASYKSRLHEELESKEIKYKKLWDFCFLSSLLKIVSCEKKVINEDLIKYNIKLFSVIPFLRINKQKSKYKIALFYFLNIFTYKMKG